MLVFMPAANVDGAAAAADSLDRFAINSGFCATGPHAPGNKIPKTRAINRFF
jgi:hypothetical protein